MAFLFSRAASRPLTALNHPIRRQCVQHNPTLLHRTFATPATGEQPRLRLGTVAPNFKAKTTQGDIDFHQWIGDKWAILFSHPADFTPVCECEN